MSNISGFLSLSSSNKLIKYKNLYNLQSILRNTYTNLSLIFIFSKYDCKSTIKTARITISVILYISISIQVLLIKKNNKFKF